MNAIAQPPAPAAGSQLDNRRVLAALVDLLIIGAGSFVIGFVIGMLGGGDASFGGAMNFVFVGWALYYYFAFESGDGQTPGKKLLKLRVVRADGGATTMREIAVRTVLRVVDGIFLYLVGLVVMLVTGEKRQRLGDLAAGTMVVDVAGSAEPATGAAPAMAIPAAPEAPEGVHAPGAGAEAAPEAPEHDPKPSTPVDIGAPLPGMTAAQQPEAPEVKEFNPFAEPEQPQPDPEPQPVAEEPQVELAPVAEEPAYEAPAYEPPAEESQVEVTPGPVAEEPVFEPEVEVTPERVAEEPVFEPRVEVAPPLEEPAYEPPAQEPQVEVVPEEPAYEAPAPHPEATAPEPSSETPSSEPPPAQPAEQASDEQMTVRPMDSPVSAMDLLMAEDEDEDEDEDEGDAPRGGEPPQSA